MKKIYFISILFLLCLIFFNKGFAQAPAISYPSPFYGYFTGQTRAPLQAINSGGAIPKLLYSQVGIIAGSGYYGYKDGLAANAIFSNPVNTAIDRQGNIYVADANINVIRKISVNGLVSTIAGSPKGLKGGVNGQDTAARFNYPTGVAVDAAGNVFVADFGNSLIRKITPSGVVSTFAGSQNNGFQDGIGTNAKFALPYNLVFDNNGNLIVADTFNNSIRKIAPDGTVTTIAGTGASGFNNGQARFATFKTPKGVTVDGLGNIYVADGGNNAIRKINIRDSVSTFAINGALDTPVSVTTDKLNNVYVASQDTFSIQKFSPNGTIAPSSFGAFSGGALKGAFNGTDTLTKYRGGMGLLYDGNDNIIVADPGSDMIKSVTVNGYFIYPRLPTGLSLDATGTITGTATTVSPLTVYTISAYNNSGRSFTSISIGGGTGPQIITFNPLPSISYGMADFLPVATSTDTTTHITYTIADTTIAKLKKGKIHIVRAGTTTITASQAANPNFITATPVTQTLLVNKAVLTATAVDTIRTAGKDNPTTYRSTYKGFFNGDTTLVVKTPPTGQTIATINSPAGNYPITLSGGFADNYTFTYLPGNLTVFPVPVITVNGQSTFAKGDSVLLTASPATGYTYRWSLNGVDIAGANGPTYYAKQAGGYAVSISSNYYYAYSAYVPITVQLQLPANNFTIKLNSVTCKGSNNGSIFISAAKKLNYTATITGNGLNTPYKFTDTLTINKLSPGNYSACMTVDGEVYGQCYQLNITEPKDLSVYSTINKSLNTLTLQLDGGTNYSINLNNVNYTTTNSDITLPLAAGVNKLAVTTDKLCQGLVEKTIDMTGIIAPYPNPFNNVLNINIGNLTVGEIQVNIVSMLNGKTVYNNKLSNRSGVLEFDLSGLADGLYYLNLNLDNKESGFKIIKK